MKNLKTKTELVIKVATFFAISNECAIELIDALGKDALVYHKLGANTTTYNTSVGVCER